MDTIEERAKKSIHQHYNCNSEYPCTERGYCVMCGADEFYEGYIKGAAEQKQIDDEENGKALLLNW